MDLHQDFRDLLAEFVSEKVSFAVIGGYAVGFHAKPRATKDLDLLVRGTDENLARVAVALGRFGVPQNVIDAVRVLKETEVAYFGVAPVRVDILRSLDGVSADECIDRAVTATIADIDVPVIAIADLITNKRAAGRPQDLADVVALESVKR